MIDRLEDITRACVRDIGYEQKGFDWRTLAVQNFLHEQSIHIAQGVDAAEGKEEGAGDQGIMFGYAVRETPELMPAPIHYAHAILRRLAEARKSGREPRLGPDAKSQLSLFYVDGQPVEVSSLVLSTQHVDEGMTSADVRAMVEPHIRAVLPEGWLTERTAWHVNPTGKFVIGGPDGDAGLTGRKIIVDTYGGAAPHGGGAFSGKDPTKVDRSAAYAARYLAKNVVAAGLADRCCLQLSYAIGVARPLSIYVDTFGTAQVRRGGDRAGGVPGDGPDAQGHPHPSGAEPPDLSAHLGLWPFRPRAGARRRVRLGADRPGRGAASGALRARGLGGGGMAEEPDATGSGGATSTGGGTARRCAPAKSGT